MNDVLILNKTPAVSTKEVCTCMCVGFPSLGGRPPIMAEHVKEGGGGEQLEVYGLAAQPVAIFRGEEEVAAFREWLKAMVGFTDTILGGGSPVPAVEEGDIENVG